MARARNIALEIIAGAQANEKHRRRFAGRYLLHTHESAGISAEADAASIAGAFAGLLPSSCGPDRSTGTSRTALEDRAVTIAVDTAVRPLAAGIRPHLAVAVDPSEAARHLNDLPDRVTSFGRRRQRRPDVFPQFKTNVTFKVSDHEPWPWLGEHAIRGTRVGAAPC